MAHKQNWAAAKSQPAYYLAAARTYPQPYAAPAMRRRNRRSGWSPWAWVVLGEVLIAVLIFALVAWAVLYYSNLIMPGVRVLGVGLGGMSKAEAVAALQQQWQQQVIILRVGDAAHAINPALLGITLDAEATVERAYRQGRSLDATEGLLPVVRVDLATAQANLQALAPQFEKSPVNAGVRIANGQVETTPAAIGQTLDVVATLARLEQNAPRIVEAGRFDLAVVALQPAVADASALAAQASQLLIGPLSFRAYDPLTDERVMWTVTPDVWGDWLVLSTDAQNAAQLSWGVDAQKVAGSIASQAVALGPERYLDSDKVAAAIADAIAARQTEIPVRVYHRERQYVVQAGETLAGIGRAYGVPYAWLQQANPGVGDGLYPGQVLTVPSSDVFLPLPVVENKRIVVSIAEQKMWVFENGSVKWEWPVSTGVASSPTSPGVFQIQSHEPNAYAGNWNLWMPYFMGIYRPVPTSDFMNGFHGFPSRDGHQLLWTNSLGHPVTYGCILISTENAALLYEWAEEGVVVEIQS